MFFSFFYLCRLSKNTVLLGVVIKITLEFKLYGSV